MLKLFQKTCLWGIIAGGTFLTGLLPVQAQDRSSLVEAEVTDLGGSFLYEFTVINTSEELGGELGTFQIVDFELPIFSLDDINDTTIQSPEGWTFEILVGKNDTSDFYNNPEGPYGDYQWDYDASTDPLLDLDPDLYGDNPEVFEDPPYIIHWYSEAQDIGDGFFLPEAPINPGQSLSGFSFESDFSDQNAPYLASWFFEPPQGGDPPIPDSGFTTPLSPARLQAQMGTSTPESSSLLGLGIALGLGLLSTQKKKLYK